MPRIRWTIELLLDIAKQYPTRKALKEANLKAYNAIMDRKIADIAFAHMELIRTYWTKEMLIDSVVGYTDIETYKKENESAYTTICNRGFNEEILGHIERKHRAHTDESLAKLAKKYTTRVDFQKKDGGSYNNALRNGFLDEACSHMAPAQKFRPELPSIFYVLTINSAELGTFIGYGITNDWSDRLRDHKLSLRKEGMSIAESKIFNLESGYIAKKIEDAFKSSFPLLAINVRGFKKENFAYEFLDDALTLLKDYNLNLE